MLRLDERRRGENIAIVGLIGFENGDAAEKAMNEEEKKVNGELVKLSYAKSLPRRNNVPQYSRTRVHVSGIGKLTQDELSEMLGKCTLFFPKKADPENMYAFAQFENEDDKQRAMDSLNGKKVDEENTLKLSPAYSQRRVPRRRAAE